MKPASLVALLLMLPALVGQSPVARLTANGSLVSTQVALGESLTLRIAGPPGALFVVGADTSPGPTLVFGTIVPLGLGSGYVELLSGSSFPGSGEAVLFAVIPQDPSLVGRTIYVAGAFAAGVLPLTVSNPVSVTITQGPTPLARNPQIPDAVYVGRRSGSPGVTCLNTTVATTQLVAPACGVNAQAPIVHGTSPTGAVLLSPNPLSGVTPIDMEVGQFLSRRVESPWFPSPNSMLNPGRGSIVPGVPDQQFGETVCGLTDFVPGALPLGPPRQPLGSFLYLADSQSNSLRVYNSYDFTLIGTIVGVTSPGGLGMGPDLSFLYVSQTNAGVVHRVYADPRTPYFHTIGATIPVGPSPTAISSHPGGEDMFVINSGDGSFSIIDHGAVFERARFVDPQAIGPRDIFVTHRMLGVGLTNAYTAYITNFFSNNVTIYESDSPAVPENGLQGNIRATFGGFSGPTLGTWNWQSFITLTAEPGCFVVNGTGSTVQELTLQNFTLVPPGFSTGMRSYHIRKTYTPPPSVGSASPSDASLDGHSGLPSIAGFTEHKGTIDPAYGGGVPKVLLVTYPSAGTVVSFDYDSPSVLGTLSVPGCDFLQGYFDQ